MTRGTFIQENTEDLRKWYQELSGIFFNEIGLKQGDYVLDFGCGYGTYAIPAAQVVGKEGRIFAIDKEQICLDEMEKSLTKSDCREIIIPIKTDGEFSFPIEKNSIDFVFLVDVLGVLIHHSRNLKVVEDLFQEIDRILKPSGIIMIIFKHTNHWFQSKEKVVSIISSNFSLVKQIDLIHIHWDILENDIVNLYKKK